ncbi:MAG TPA: chromate efflux transporter, partial [Polyangia bacterium]|nr:chromate efflux transporter [Polyangia bacterium]
EVVERRGWITDAQFLRLLGFANILPGPEALELAIHIGYLRRGSAGAVVAGLLFILPGFVSLTALAWLYATYGQLPVVAAVLDGVRPIAVALIAAAVLRLSGKSLSGWPAYGIAAVAFIASVAGLPFMVILLLAGMAGLALGARLRGKAQQPRQLPAAATKAARLRGAILIALLAAPLMWGVARPHAVVTAPARGTTAHASLTDIALCNSKTALMTFGGAYTALPYMREEFVERQRWLSDADMMTALALGETTPGPLITVGVFLSYLAAGFAGAGVGCVFLFLPSFILVIGLGRYLHKIERVRGARDVVGGVSAATIGLIVALAADVTPQGIHDLFGLVIATTALVAVTRFKTSAVLLVTAGALSGIVRSLVI